MLIKFFTDKKAFLISIFIIFTIPNIHAQKYFAKCTITSEYNETGICFSDRRFQNLKIVSPISINSQTNFSYSPSSILWYQTGSFNSSQIILYRIVNKYNNLGLVFNPSDFNVFSQPDNVIYSYIDNPKIYDTKVFEDQVTVGSLLGGICKYKGKITFKVTTYDAVDTFTINGLASGESHCISSINDYIAINLGLLNNSGGSLTLKVYTANNVLIGTKNIGSYSASKSVRFSDLNLQNHWGEDVYFQIRSSLGGQNIYSDKVGAIFFRQIPEPTINVRQRACEPHVLFDMTLDNETINKLKADPDSYKFRISGEESLSNVFKLEKHGSIVNNTITLVGGGGDDDDTQGTDFVPADGQSYTIQIYQNVHGDNPPSMANISCARNIENVSLDTTPHPIVFTDTLTEYTFTDSQNNTHTYHITRNGLSDGEAILSLTNENNLRLKHFQAKKDNELFWYNIHVKDYKPNSYSYNNLDAGQYHLRAVDSDGCFSDTADFEIIEPDPLIIDSLRSTLVSCHENNTGTGSHSDAQINTYWGGGIGTYNISVKNAGSELVFEKDSINTYDKQTLDTLPAGDYTVYVSDNYGAASTGNITVESNPEIILSGVANDCRCNGDGNGTIELSVVNKTTDYVDFHLTDQDVKHTLEDTAFYNYLDTGNYTASVINTKGCEDIVTDLIIAQPNILELTGTTNNPICYNSYDGNIITNTEGGNGSYQYLWSNGETTADIFNLNSGIYTLTVTDAEDCSNQEIFEIIPPYAPSAGWKETSAILCTGNTLTLDGGNFVSYEWQKDGIPLSSERNYTLTEPGTYTLSITDELGCMSTDTFELEVSDHTLDAVLLLQDSTGINELTEAIDVTWPVPDSINWFFDKPIVRNESGSWFQQFLSEEEGIITVTLRAWSDGCYSDSSKTITIYNNENFEEKRILEESPLILGFRIYPNPTDGNFIASVKLSRRADIRLKIFSLVNSSIINDKIHKGLKHYEVPYRLNNLITGAYIIILSAENERQSLKFIVK